MPKKNILFVIPWLPYPLESGGHQALFNGIAAVKDDMNVTIAYEATDDEAYHRAEKDFLHKVPNAKLFPLLNKPIEPPTIWHRIGYKIRMFVEKIFGINPHYKIDNEKWNIQWWKGTITPSSREWVEHITKICKHNKFDIIQIEMPWRVSDVFILPDSAKKVYVHHELGFVRRELEMNQLQDRKVYADAVRKFADYNEIGQLNMYDSIITLSPIDTQKLEAKGVVKPIYSSFAIIDAAPLENTVIGDGKRLTFIGPSQHSPNFVGITWFLENCWARLKSLDPEITLDIIGKWSEARKQEYSAKYPGVNFLGFVDDLNAAIQGSTMIVPITVGSGIRMKILEASSKGVPFVSTTVGAEGIPVTDGKDCFLTDDPATFVQDLLKLQNKDLRQQFITNAHEMVKSHYSLEALRKNRLEIYEKVCKV